MFALVATIVLAGAAGLVVAFTVIAAVDAVRARRRSKAISAPTNVIDLAVARRALGLHRDVKPDNAADSGGPRGAA